MPSRLSLREARRIALAAQSFGRPSPATVGPRQLLALAERLGLFQIDSVSVLARAHYLPAFSRFGRYDSGLLDRIAWGPRRERRLFEYWAHEASLLPLSLLPLFRWRMAWFDGAARPGKSHVFAGERRAEAMALLERIREEGPLAASDFEQRGQGGWWGWSETKRALEWLFASGRLTTATRRTSFERVYDLPERVLPASILDLPTPSERDARRALVRIAARALGVATEPDLRDHFRLDQAGTKLAIAELVEEGELIEVAVEGWRDRAWLHRDASRPRKVRGAALLAPFDPLVWFRARALRLFGFHYRIGIYTPADQRTHGYYPLPFLLDEALVARVDLKADRKAGRLLVQSLHPEPGAPDFRDAMAAELVRVAEWLGLEPPTAV